MFINEGMAGEHQGKGIFFFFSTSRERKGRKIIKKAVSSFSSRSNKAKNIGLKTGVKGEKSLMSGRCLGLVTFCLTKTSILLSVTAS